MQQEGGEMGSDHKEDHSEPHMNLLKTPLKQAATSHSVLTDTQPDCQPLTTPPKAKEIPPADPWTPTSNLKMLISAASPEIRRREQRRELPNNASEVPQEHLLGDEYERFQPSRKEKSLGRLCNKFLARYPDYPSTEDNFIYLEEVAEELNVERRRIYDILNVLDSLYMVSRHATNTYVWHGRHNLFKTLQALQKVGEEYKYAQQMQMIKKKEYKHEFDFSDGRNEEMAGYFGSTSVNGRKGSSLRVMSQKFVTLFLVSTPQVVSLEVAAKILIGEDQLEDLHKIKIRSKIRRLYDIANVLSSLKLIKKVLVTEEKGRKPAFKWTGPEILPDTQGTDQNFSAFPSKMAPVPAITKLQLEGQSKKAKKIGRKLSQSALECTLSSPEAVAKAKAPRTTTPALQPALTQPLTGCTPSHSSVSPVILPHDASGAMCVIYQNPSQTDTVTTYSPSFMQPVLCANVTGIKTINSKGLNKTTTHEGDGQTAIDDPTKSLTAEEKLPIKSETSSQRGVKRSQALQENTSIKRFRSDKKSLDTSLGESSRNESPSNISQIKHKKDNFQENRLNKPKTLDQNTVGSYDQCKREDEDETKMEQDIPIAFAIPAHETFFPFGYLIPLTHYIHGNKAGFSIKEKAGICSLQHATYSSPIAGVIPSTTSELKTANISTFHINPLNIMLSPASMGAALVISNSCLTSSNTSSVQNPSPSVLNFTLQHVGLIASNAEVPANPALPHVPVPSQPKSVSHSSENVHLQDEKPCVPKEPKDPQTATENFFRTPGGPNTVSSLSANSDGTDRTSQEPLRIPQRKLELSED